jgi:hypothetical protein
VKLVVLRGEEPPDDAIVVVRAGANGLSDDTLRRTATASHEEYGFFGVSVFLALDLSVDELCASNDSLHRYSMIQESTAGQVRDAGFPLLATEARPHYDVVLPDLDGTVLDRLRSCFDPPRPNPGRS